MEVFIDESGDLGYKEGSTKYFVVAFLYVRDTPPFRDKFRWLHRRLVRHYRYFYDELKFSESKDSVRRKGLQLICDEEGCNFGIVVVNKSRIWEDHEFYHDNKLLYRYIVVHNVMNGLIPKLAFQERLNVIIDRRIEKRRREEFDRYVKLKAYQVSRRINGRNIVYSDRIFVDHRDSKFDPCLQAADFLAGAEFQRFERRNYAYHNIIRNKMNEFIYWPRR